MLLRLFTFIVPIWWKYYLVVCCFTSLFISVFSDFMLVAWSRTWWGTAAPNLFGTRDWFCGRQFFHWRGVRWGEMMVSGWFRRIYCALCFYYYYTVICNEIIIQLTIMQNQWEPWACFHLPLTDRVLMWVCKQLVYYGLCAVRPLC